MTDCRLIENYIRARGYRMGFVASALHISSNALRHKLDGKVQFRLDEAEGLSNLLGLTMAERDACFFSTLSRAEHTIAEPAPARRH